MRRLVIAAGSLAAVLAIAVGASRLSDMAKLGKQADGGFVVSSGQRIPAGTVAFDGRPNDMTLHPSGQFVAVVNKRGRNTAVFLATPEKVLADSTALLPANANPGFHGIAWSPDGKRLVVSTDKGYLATFTLDGEKLTAGPTIEIQRPGAGPRVNPVPGGLCFTRDGSRLFVAAANFNAIVEIDAATNSRLRELPTQTLPYECRLTDDESTLVVSNWAGRPPRPGERTQMSDKLAVLVDEKGAPASGSVSVIDVKSGQARHVETGVHPTGIAVRGGIAYVACAMSDTVAVIDIAAAKLTKSIPIVWGQHRLLGSMPNALALHGDTLYVANGGDNALCEVDLKTDAVRGFRPVGFYPVAVALPADGKRALVLNTKGNGSVANTVRGKPGNAHDFQGTLSALDLSVDLAAETAAVAANNRWDQPLGSSKLQVYNGAIEHVVYIIKENRTYDEIYGDLPQGDGDPKLCSLGETVMPNHRKLAREFTLFDNAYCSGTNSADGHAWSTQSMANDYMEHFYVGGSRSYSDDGEDPMSFSNAGAIWDAAVRKKLSLRVWGEFCEDSSAEITPKPTDWFEVWEDRKAGGKKFKFKATCKVAGLQPYVHPEYLYWPLWQSDQQRADFFIAEFEQFVKAGTVPRLMILSLPCDHGEGTNPKFPTPRAMMADNDLALGRIVEAITNSPVWKKTCIFVVEDDAQSGPDHVDGHRTSFLAISPYTKRKYVDSTRYVQTNMLRSISMILKTDPLNKFDACSYPMEACFSDVPNFTPYKSVASNVKLDERNPSGAAMTPRDRFWMEKTLALDWSELDAPDPYWLNRINWYSIFKDTRPYPGREGERPLVGEPLDE